MSFVPLDLGHEDEWFDIVARSYQHDIYHLPGYHRLAAANGEGTPFLFCYEDSGDFIAVPLLIRPIPLKTGKDCSGDVLYDATSVYGYPGPVASRADLPERVVSRFKTCLSDELRRRRVVSVFSRLHPLIHSCPLLNGLGRIARVGTTVSIDLTHPEEEQRRSYRRDHKRDINALKREGYSISHDLSRRYLDEFIDIYYETMDRVGASEDYYFSYDYFRELFSEQSENVHLFVAMLEGRLVAGAIVTICDGIVQTYLSGHRAIGGRLAPKKLLIDEVRKWAVEQRAHTFHLGGGVGGKEDSVYRFKAGFANQEHEFHVWRWVLDDEAYDALVWRNDQSNERSGIASTESSFFPLYRTPVLPARARVGR
jgi:hypothetical protein